MSFSVKLISPQCGVYSRRFEFPNEVEFAHFATTLASSSSEKLLYRENPGRCSELVALENDR